ncbi:MAG: ABC transporter ATP-binding protein [Thermoplasmata archaeon YP2-bin.285]|uniref:ABC transporter ATP-binding protein n=2 Tax=Candidatus Sysuiplasma superficiale TaxID=2823368 RepID=A0A8J7YMY1_9ARCH|nr:ABC transporter ATP-binding protein [Candidatus Sysuiplasma superficiale]
MDVRHLKQLFPIKAGVMARSIGYVHAVDDISFQIYQGETVGLVGESGCGKTTTGRTILRLLEPTSGQAFVDAPDDVFGEIDSLYAELEGIGDSTQRAEEIIARIREIAEKYSVFKAKGVHLRNIRKTMQIVFQDPFASLDPRMLVKDILAEPLRIYREGTKEEIKDRVSSLISDVGLNEEHLYRFPHEFSGGQRQRICVARALALNPKFIVLDEPTSALDVSVQAQILNLLRNLQLKNNMSYLFISHHLSVIRAMCNRVLVMYLGKIVEVSETEELFVHPLHPYTQALISAIPIPDPLLRRERIILSGDVPSAASPPSGCRFRTRCPYAEQICREKEPKLLRWNNTPHLVACHLIHRMDSRIIEAAERASVMAGEHFDESVLGRPN